MFNVVAYGTLMFPEVAFPIAGIETEGEAVTVLGYRRYLADIDRTWGKYPAIVPDRQASFDGLLFRGLTQTQIEKLDWFEDIENEFYTRMTHQLTLPDGESLPVELYVCGPRLQDAIKAKRSWNPELFRRNELDTYIERMVKTAINSDSYKQLFSKN